MKDTLQDLVQTHSISTGWRQLLQEHFKCQICWGIIQPPIIVSTCCCTILGCQDCLEQWYSLEDNNTCPTCRAENQRNSSTKLRGLNELLQKN